MLLVSADKDLNNLAHKIVETSRPVEIDEVSQTTVSSSAKAGSSNDNIIAQINKLTKKIDNLEKRQTERGRTTNRFANRNFGNRSVSRT